MKLPPELTFSKEEMAFFEAACFKRHCLNRNDYMNGLDFEKLVVSFYRHYRPDYQVNYQLGSQQQGEDIEVNGIRISLKGGTYQTRNNRIYFNGSQNSNASSYQEAASDLASGHQDYILSLAHSDGAYNLGYHLTVMEGKAIDDRILNPVTKWSTVDCGDVYGRHWDSFELRLVPKKGYLSWFKIPVGSYSSYGTVVSEFNFDYSYDWETGITGIRTSNILVNQEVDDPYDPSRLVVEAARPGVKIVTPVS